MIQSEIVSDTTASTLLAGWISRRVLAVELGISVDTLGRWEARRVGPPCVRAGRKVLYRRSICVTGKRRKRGSAPASGENELAVFYADMVRGYPSIVGYIFLEPKSERGDHCRANFAPCGVATRGN